MKAELARPSIILEVYEDSTLVVHADGSYTLLRGRGGHALPPDEPPPHPLAASAAEHVRKVLERGSRP